MSTAILIFINIEIEKSTLYKSTIPLSNIKYFDENKYMFFWLKVKNC